MADLMPVFRREPSGLLTLYDSPTAGRFKQLPKKEYGPPKKGEIVKQEAIEAVRRAGGDVQNQIHRLGQYRVQFGVYREMTFLWVVSNAPGYAAWMALAGEEEPSSSSPNWANKMAMRLYLRQFEDGKTLIEMKRKEHAAKVPPPKPADMSDDDLVRAAELIESEHLAGPVQSKTQTQLPLSTACQTETSGDSVLSGSTRLPSGQSKQSIPEDRSQHLSSLPVPTPQPDMSDEDLVKAAEMIHLAGDATASLKFEPLAVVQSRKKSVASSENRSQESETMVQLQPATTFIKPSMISTGNLPYQPDTKSTSEAGQSLPVAQRSKIVSTSIGKTPFTNIKSAAVTVKKPLAGAQSTLALSASTGADQQESSEGQQEGQSDSSSQAQSLQPTTATSDLTLYQHWRDTLPAVDHSWVSSTFFRMNAHNKPEFRIEKANQLWHHPPQPSMSPNNVNRLDRYFAHRLFLWMPVNIWGVLLQCTYIDPDTDTPCGGSMVTAGVHQKTRLVLDIDSYYVIATEYLRCSRCTRKKPAWAHKILSQLDQDKQLLFPCILTARYACDIKVVEMLRNRGLGNSSSMVMAQLEESHGEQYLKSVHHYATNLKVLKSRPIGQYISTPTFLEPPPITPIPGHRWLMKIYQLDVIHRLDFIKASLTSHFGNILKMDSTKKITKKLAGKSAKTAMWATNVGNEYGQVLMSVLTTNEGQLFLR